MPIITFWSSNEKAIGQTVSASAVATVMAMEYNYKILLISADINDDTIENCYGTQESNKEIIKTLVATPQINLDSGINGLLKLADSNRITPNLIHDYTKIIFKNRLEVLYSPMNIVSERKPELLTKIKDVIEKASKYYDYVIVDLAKGLKCSQQLDIMQISDVIVNTIDQNIKKIENGIKIKDIQPLLKKCIWNICKYDNKSKYNSKNILRTVLRKQAIYETPYNTLVFEAAQEGNIVELLIRLKTLKDEDDNLVFLTKMEELVQGILLKYNETRSKM